MPPQPPITSSAHATVKRTAHLQSSKQPGAVACLIARTPYCRSRTPLCVYVHRRKPPKPARTALYHWPQPSAVAGSSMRRALDGAALPVPLLPPVLGLLRAATPLRERLESW